MHIHIQIIEFHTGQVQGTGWISISKLFAAYPRWKKDEKTTPNKIEESNSTQIIVTFFFLLVTMHKNHGSSSFIPLEITIDLMIFH